MKCGLPMNSSRTLILREPSLPTGVPDLVAVELRDHWKKVANGRRKLHLPHLQVLHFLNDFGPATELDIVRLLNFPSRETSTVVGDLLEACLVTRRCDEILARPTSEVFVARRIVAIEAKMRAWRDALEQAAGNLWFASHSYVLVPALRCLRAIAVEARKLGVGVLVFDGKRTRTVVCPRKQAIPASYGSWLINEWAVQQLR